MEWTRTPLNALLDSHPFAADFLAALGKPVVRDSRTLEEWTDQWTEAELEDTGFTREELLEHFTRFMFHMNNMRADSGARVTELKILAGTGKSGEKEQHDLVLCPGDVVSIVGPTGSGKSRLLADIEWMAQGDTPTGRRVLLDGKVPASEWRFSPEHKLVAQLSQNMNFVMDLTVGEFVRMHAESRLIPDPEQVIADILEQANHLAGEPFSLDTPVTSLSGGQSRALMIADTAVLSRSPIVLIDEIENAGIDRKLALQLLVKAEKIVLIATHDPVLALMADRRIVIRNGAVANVLETTDAERASRRILEKADSFMMQLRQTLRNGGRLEEEVVSVTAESAVSSD